MFLKKIEDGKAVGYLMLQESVQHILNSQGIDFSTVNSSPDFWENLGYAVITTTERPKITALQYIEEADTVKNSDGLWVQTWAIKEKSDEEKKRLFDEEMERVTYKKVHRIEYVTEDLIKAPEYMDVLDELNAYKAALEAVDLSDPFNVKWPDPLPEETGISMIDI